MSKDDIDQEFSEVIQAFIQTMVALEQEANDFEAKADHFNTLLNLFFDQHPEASLASVADGVTQLGVPYERAIADVLRLRTIGRSEL